MSRTFDVLHDGDYKAYLSDPWDLLGRYTVVKPGGGIIAVTSTLWGARRKIRRHKAKLRRRPERSWWDGPIAYRESTERTQP